MVFFTIIPYANRFSVKVTVLKIVEFVLFMVKNVKILIQGGWKDNFYSSTLCSDNNLHFDLSTVQNKKLGIAIARCLPS